jgi:uncharacterized protein YoaH (UPF0181 family)
VEKLVDGFCSEQIQEVFDQHAGKIPENQQKLMAAGVSEGSLRRIK